MSTLCHITLDLPGEFDFVRNIKINAEINQIVDTVVVERMQTFNDKDLRRCDIFRGIQKSRNMVVNGLGNALTLFQSFHLRCISIFTVKKGEVEAKNGSFNQVLDVHHRGSRKSLPIYA